MKARYSWRIHKTGKITYFNPKKKKNESENFNQILTVTKTYFAEFILLSPPLSMKA